MSLQATVGWSRVTDATRAGSEATSSALRELTGPPDWLMVFATTGYDQAALLEAIRRSSHGAPLIGCSAEGIITAEGSDEGACAVAVLAVRAPTITASRVSVEQVGDDPIDASERLEASLRCHLDESRARGDQQRLLILLLDGVTTHHATFVAGLEERLPDDLPIVGGTAGDMLRFERTFQYLDDRVMSDAAVALLLTGDFEVRLGVSHGCDPVGLQHTVTHARDGYVYAIDDRPAWEVFCEYLDDPDEGLHALNVAYLSMAQRLDDDDPHDDATIIRNPLQLDPDTGALFFPGGLRDGDRVQIAIRNPERIGRHAARVAQRIRDAHDRAPSLVLQFDCAGRGRLLFGERTSSQIVHPLRETLGESIPWIGFHTYGEIGPRSGRTRFHNYTVVLCALYTS